MQRLDLIGMKLSADQKQLIKNKLNQLTDRAPFNSTITLTLEKRKSSVKGILTIENLTDKFVSEQIASDPLQTYLLLQVDIDGQIMDWKKTRFKNTLYNLKQVYS